MRPFLDRFLPFVILGVAITLGFFSLILLGYLVLFGLIVGSVLYCIAWLRMKFFSSKHLSHYSQNRQPQGRTFDAEE